MTTPEDRAQTSFAAYSQVYRRHQKKNASSPMAKENSNIFNQSENRPKESFFTSTDQSHYGEIVRELSNTENQDNGWMTYEFNTQQEIDPSLITKKNRKNKPYMKVTRCKLRRSRFGYGHRILLPPEDLQQKVKDRREDSVGLIDSDDSKSYASQQPENFDNEKSEERESQKIPSPSPRPVRRTSKVRFVAD